MKEKMAKIMLKSRTFFFGLKIDSIACEFMLVVILLNLNESIGIVRCFFCVNLKTKSKC